MLAKIRQVQDLALPGTVDSTCPDCTRKTQPFGWSPSPYTELWAQNKCRDLHRGIPN